MLTNTSGHKIIVLTFMLILFWGAACTPSPRSEKSLPAWVIGKWKGDMQLNDSTGAHKAEIQIDFVDSNHLIFYSSSFLEQTDEPPFGFPFSYEFISENKIVLKSRLLGELDMSRDANRLSIKFPEQTVSFTRIPRIERYIALSMAILLIAISLFKVPNKIANISEDIKEHKMREGWSSIFDWFSNFLVIIVSLIISSIVLYGLIWSRWFFFVGMPWGPIVLIEGSLVLVIIGSKFVKDGHSSTKVRGFWSHVPLDYLKTAVVSSGLCGILAGLLMWAAFVFISYSYLGVLFLY